MPTDYSIKELYRCLMIKLVGSYFKLIGGNIKQLV